MSTELATVDGEVIEQRAPLTLFGTDDPQAVVERATAVATALKDVLVSRHLVKRIGNREFVLLEGWTLLGSMLGVFAKIEWTRPVEDGWEARAVVSTMSGAVVGGTEAMCTRKESTWKSRDDYAIRSMAQTRAMAKALRMPLGFVVQLAGYDPTPADEMPDESAPQASQTAHEAPKGQIPISALRERVVRVAGEHDMPAEVLRDVVDSVYGGRTFESLSGEELLAFGTDIHHGKYDLPFDPPSGGTEPVAAAAAVIPPAPSPTLDDILAATGGELIDQPEQGERGLLPPVPVTPAPVSQPGAVLGKGAAESAPPSAPNPLDSRIARAKARAAGR